jgi:hypothetical protein
VHILCEHCKIPLCRPCFLTSQQQLCGYGIPEALANDNYHGYVTAIIYKYKVRWIEAAAACPIFTALITYYAEGERGHLMEEEMHGPQRAYNVRSRDWPQRNIGYPLVFSSHTFPTLPCTRARRALQGLRSSVSPKPVVPYIYIYIYTYSCIRVIVAAAAHMGPESLGRHPTLPRTPPPSISAPILTPIA